MKLNSPAWGLGFLVLALLLYCFLMMALWPVHDIMRAALDDDRQGGGVLFMPVTSETIAQRVEMCCLITDDADDK